MKALGVTLLDRIMYLAQLQLITREERIEYAKLVQIAMEPNNEIYYGLLRKKLKDKANSCEDALSEHLYSTIELIPTNI